jgi:hypothetical protein
MKQSNHNDVDLLLRSLARSDEESWPGDKSANAVVSDHLDADELNVYAEGVLPAPARARYTEHLADCQRCRTLVVALAQSAGRSVRQETTSQQSGASFWHNLVTLFSLPVLRYALPALVLTGVIAIGLMALREQRRTDLVALNQRPESPMAEAQKSETSGNASTSASPASVLQRQGSDKNIASSEPKTSPAHESGLVAQKPGSNIGGITTDGTAAKDAPESPQVTGAATTPPRYAPEPAPPPKVSSEADLKSAPRKEDSFAPETMNRQQDEVKLLSKDDSPTHGPARSRAMAAGSRRGADATAENRAAGSKARKQVAEEVEVRTVSGRRFRREGNAWVDTAFEASRGATNVSRGSEQFRALMADEAGLRAIVQQLAGEVVVVWKNRAYRFR